MRPLIARGRVYFFLIATLIVLDRLLGLVIALSAENQDESLLRSVGFPVATIGVIGLLWRGELWLRWVLAISAVGRGTQNLFAIGWVIYHLAIITPVEQAAAFVELTAITFGVSLFYACFYIFAGFAFIRSRSIKAYLQHQSETAGDLLSPLTDRLFRLFTKKRSEDSFQGFMREHENRRRYPILTRELLESLDDQELVRAVADYVRIEIGHNYSREYEIVTGLSPGFQAVYSTRQLELERFNGGIHQFFFNRDVEWAFLALEGFKRFDAPEAAAAMAEAIETYLGEPPQPQPSPPDDPKGLIEGYLEDLNSSDLPKFDARLNEFDVDELAAHYIRQHLDEFVTV